MMVFVLTPSVLADISLYVAPNGNDSNPGTIESPFKTITRAQKAVRDIKKAKAPTESITVFLRDGRYRIDKLLVFTPKDSGAEKFPITWRSYQKEKAVISGGRNISGWKKKSKNLWQATVPEMKKGKLYFSSLFVNGRRAVRARTPNKGYLYTAGPIARLAKKHGTIRKDDVTMFGFRFRKGDIRQWDNLEDVMVTFYHPWLASLHWVKEVDSRKGVVRFRESVRKQLALEDPMSRYTVENYYEALDAPGEWYLNRKTGILSYYPRDGEDMSKAVVTAPVVDSIIRIEGDPEKGTFVDYLHFRGLSFQYSDMQGDGTYIHRRGNYSMQAFANMDIAGIWAKGARHLVIENCEVAHLGSHGIWLEEGSKYCTVKRCHIYDLAGGGVYIGNGQYQYKAKNDNVATHHNTVDNCFIHDLCHVYHGSVGVWIGCSSHNAVTHNEISDMDYTGISVGFTWRSWDVDQEGNTIAFNHIHHLMNGVLADGGGIYTLGDSRGTRIQNNLIHDLVPYPYKSFAIGLYQDQASADMLLENNIVYNVASRGFGYHLHYGERNTVRNNIFAFIDGKGINRTKKFAKENEPITIEGNIVYAANEMHPFIGGTGFLPGKVRCDRNVYFNTRGYVDFRDIKNAKIGFDEWQELGNDANGVVADPLFKDAGKFDFTLDEKSPALAKGFKRIDVGKIGLYGEKEWVALPERVRREPVYLPPPNGLMGMLLDFEGQEPGDFPLHYRISDDKTRSVTVSDKGALGSKRCLKFQDAKGNPSWKPHIWNYVHIGKGRVVFSFYMMNDQKKPARVLISFRDWRTRLITGPNVVVTRGNSVTVGKVKCGTIPRGTWGCIEIDFTLGEGAAKTFTLKVTTSEGTKTTKDLPFESVDFEVCTWYGFVSATDEEAYWYLDKVKIDSK